jgi:hypothetical protein
MYLLGPTTGKTNFGAALDVGVGVGGSSGGNAAADPAVRPSSRMRKRPRAVVRWLIGEGSGSAREGRHASRHFSYRSFATATLESPSA